MRARLDSVARQMDGKGRTAHKLLGGGLYSIGYYLHEYKNKKKHIADLIDDFSTMFLEDQEEGNERSDAVVNYGHNFLGSISVRMRMHHEPGAV